MSGNLKKKVFQLENLILAESEVEKGVICFYQLQ